MWQTKRFDELKATGQLPSPSGVAMRILKMAQSDGAGPAEVSRVVQGDPALTGQILKLVNSAFYAGARSITAVSDAVARLGLGVVWQVALGFSVISSYRRGTCLGFDYDRFWSHSLATAVGAQQLSRFLRRIQAEEAFTCGLLGRIGSLALATIYPQAYANVLSAAADQREADLLRIEQETFAMDQRELTAGMLHDWGLADNWVQGVRFYHEPSQSGLDKSGVPFRLAVLLNTASQIGRICQSEKPRRLQLVEQLSEHAKTLDIAWNDFTDACERIEQEWVNWGSTLGVKTKELPPLYDPADEAKAADPIVTVPAPAAPNISGLRVLVVADDLAASETVGQALPAGGKVVCARSVEEALSLAIELDPQMMLIDWDLAGNGALDICRALRKSKAGQQVYVFLFAREHNEELLAQALEAGANEFIPKPILRRGLEARFNVALRVIRLQQEAVRDREEIRRHLTELAVLNRTLEQAALTDPLTGLPNRRYAMDRLAQEWAASFRTKGSLSCMIVDLDHFKRINDTHGHDAGDVVLREVASALRKSMRAMDVVCRIGGEEFLILCRDTDATRAAGYAERLRHRVEAHPIHVSGIRICMTISVGIADRQDDVADAESLVKRADLATYASKSAGRNRVTVFAPELLTACPSIVTAVPAEADLQPQDV